MFLKFGSIVQLLSYKCFYVRISYVGELQLCSICGNTHTHTNTYTKDEHENEGITQPTSFLISIYLLVISTRSCLARPGFPSVQLLDDWPVTEWPAIYSLVYIPCRRSFMNFWGLWKEQRSTSPFGMTFNASR